jgi:FAD/FMN-containing dehydrogenase
VVSDTGIAGLTLGGGLGWLRRKHGLSCDNLIAADLVTADGHLLHTSEAEHPELLWGLRGGGGNFGVVTSFEFRLHPVGPEVMLCFVLYPAEIAPEALRFYRQYSATAPDEISSFAIFGTVPAADLFPQQAHGRPYLALMACHCGTVEQGERDMRPLRELATPIADLSGAMPFVDVQKLFDEDYPAHIMRYYWKSAYLDDLDDEVIEHLIELNRARPSAHSTLDIWQLGGAMSRVEPGATAFGTRRAPFMIGVESNWEHPEDDTTNVDWARKVVRDLQRFSDGSEYLNFPGFFESGEAAVKTSFGANYDRLIELKTRYDPGNLFRLNPNIKPAEQ